jgi:hypothetical protein
MRAFMISVASIGILSGCGAQASAPAQPPDPSTITSVVRQYFDAYNAGDVDGLNAASC